MTPHTPGPWVIEPHADDAEHLSITAMAQDWIADCNLGDHRLDENEANACLIAAAPDLLAALKAVARVTDMTVCTRGQDGDPACHWCGEYADDRDTHRHNCALLLARAAIAKAEDR